MASRAKVSQQENRACRQGGSPPNRRVCVLFDGTRFEDYGVSRGGRPAEETTLRAQTERAQSPILCALSNIGCLS